MHSEEQHAKWRAAGARYRAAHPGRELERDRKMRATRPDSYRNRKREEARRRREQDPEGERKKRHEKYLKNRGYHKRWNEAHRAQGCAATAKWRGRYPDYGFVHGLKVDYGMDPEDYDHLFDVQEGVCAICGQPESSPVSPRNPRKRRLAVDRDHATGKIRGLLCYRCNTGIGMLGEDPQRLRAAAFYLEV